MKKASKYTAHQKLEHAELALQRQDVDEARECLRDAAELAPQDAEVLDAFGALLAEHGPQDEAVKVLQQAVAVAPVHGHEKYMYLGQLLEGQDSVKSFERGIDIMRGELRGQEPDEEGAAALSGALCALAEAHMHAADVEQVGPQVEALLREALQLGASPEPLQALASLRVEQGRPDEALAALQQSMALWYTPHPDSTQAQAAVQQAAAGGKKAKKGAKEAAKQQQQPRAPLPPEERPSYEFRLESVKLLLELEDTVETAAEVLQDLIEEDDRVIETWYLFAMCLHAGGEHAEAASAVERGQALAKTLGMPADDPLVLAFADTRAHIEKALADDPGEDD